MDDVEDNSELRRGTPVAHTIYGVPQTINTANYVYFQAVQELLKLQAANSPGVSPVHDEKAKGQEKGKGKGKENDLIGLVTGTSILLSISILNLYLDFEYRIPSLESKGVRKDITDLNRGITQPPSWTGTGFILEGFISLSDRGGICTYGPWK
jgi:hypothetical protein